MNILICGPINPYEMKDYLYNYDDLPSFNKGASAVNTIVKEFLRANHTVYVVTCSAPPSRTGDNIVLKGNNFEIHVVHSNPGIFLSSTLSRLYMVDRIRKYINRFINKVDVIHAHWTYEYALASDYYSDIIPTFCTVRDWCPFIIKTQKGLKKIQWYLYYLIFKKVMRSKNIHFIANSDYTKKQILNVYKNKVVETIYNPIDKTLIVDNYNSANFKGTFISISSSESDERKNIPNLLKAFQLYREKHPGSSLRLVGGGFVEASKVMQKFKAQGLLNGVVLCGYKSHSDLIKEIDNSYCLVHPSYEETFGNILIEAMARGRICIGGDKSGAVPQVLGYGKYGILCDVSSCISICNAMEQSTDCSTCAKTIENAHEYLVNNYSSDAVAKKHIELYNKELV